MNKDDLNNYFYNPIVFYDNIKKLINLKRDGGKKMHQLIDQKIVNKTRHNMTEYINRSRWVTNILFIFAMVFSFCTASALAQDAEEKNLKQFYKQNCVKCHGVDGSAVSAEGKKLKGEDFTDQKWQRETSDDKIIKVILKGKFFGLAMPGYKKVLSRSEAQLMATDIIRKSKKGQIID